MAEPLTPLDLLLLSRWEDAVGIWEAIADLEDRLADHLQLVAARLEPWLVERGFQLYGRIDKNRAAIYVTKKAWMKSRETALIYLSVGALLPFGYRSVEDEHPYVWLHGDELKERERDAFRTELNKRFARNADGWINPDCNDKWPLGRYIETHADRERIRLAQSDEEMEQFVKSSLIPIFDIAVQIDAALGLARPQSSRASSESGA